MQKNPFNYSSLELIELFVTSPLFKSNRPSQYYKLSLMITDLTLLAQLKRTDLKPPGQIVKYLVTEGTEQIPPSSKLWISYKKYNFQGEFLISHKSFIYKESENFKHRNPPSFGSAISTMKKGEVCWLRFSAKECSHGKEQVNLRDGCYFLVSIEKYKVLSLASDNVEDRRQIFRENKKVAKQHFDHQNYHSAFEYYRSCKHSYVSIPGKRDISTEIKEELQKQVNICTRNMALCVLKGRITEQYDKSKIMMEQLVKLEPDNAKNYYILGKIQLALKYVVFAKESLVKSYKLGPNSNVLALIKELEKKEKSQKFVFKKVVDNFEEFIEKEEDEELRNKRREERQITLKFKKEEEKRQAGGREEEGENRRQGEEDEDKESSSDWLDSENEHLSSDDEEEENKDENQQGEREARHKE